ncbi:unnamed protein product [Calypogeia fissa]
MELSTSPSQHNTHIMESLFFSMAVYETTPDRVLQFLHQRFGKVEPMIAYGFGQDADDQQAIFVARSPSGRIIVACRGTAGFRDIVADLKYLKSRLSFVKGAAAHWGFAERAESVPIDFFCKLLAAGEEIIFAGHSLGGAVASLLSLRVLESSKGAYDDQVHCITFGCPLFASCRLADLINSKYKEVFTHIVSSRDVVPKLMPLVSTLQKLAYGDEDHLEGLFVFKNLLSLLPGVPLGAMISGIERRVPSLIKLLFRGFMKLAFPTGMSGSYAFAGHVVMLNTEGPLERSLVLANANDMNVWHSQLGFAFGSGFDGTMIEEHMLQSYHNGIVRSLSHMRVGRDVPFGGVPSLTLGGGKGCDGKLQQQPSLVIRFTPPESNVSTDCRIQFRGDGEASPLIVVTQSARQQDLRCRACSHLRMHMHITACCHKVSSRQGLGFGWLLGTIGRLSRHLRLLDNLCYLTFVRIVMANFMG